MAETALSIFSRLALAERIPEQNSRLERRKFTTLGRLEPKK